MQIKIDDITIDTEQKSVAKDGNNLLLYPFEYEFLELLAKNPGKKFNREELFNAVWGADSLNGLQIVDHCAQRLRLMIENDPSTPELVKTEWGVGYSFKA